MFQNPEERKEQSRAEDKAWIKDALAGEQDAYKKLLKKYHSALSHMIAQLVGYQPDVEDLVQEAFIKAFNSLPSYKQEWAFSTWLFRIASNNSIDYLRKRKLRTFSIDKPIRNQDGEQHFEIPDESALPDSQILRAQQTMTIQEAIASLPEKYRQVIELRHQNEKSYDEIAKILRLPIGTVKAHIFRAREMLYRLLRGKVGNY